jgi:hypothetical protein
VLGRAHKRYLTARLLLPVLAQSSSAVLWVFPPRARQVRHIASRHGVEGAQMRNNKQGRRLGSRLQGAGRREQGTGAGGAGCLAGHTNGTLQRDCCQPCSHNPAPPQSCGFPPPCARQVRHIAGRHGVEGAQMRNNKQGRSLGSRLQGAGSRGWGRRVLGRAHKRYLTAGLSLPVLTQSSSAVLWVPPPRAHAR